MCLKMAKSQQNKSKSSKEIKALFDLFDKDNNGAISKHELKIGFRATGYNPTEKEIDEFLEDEMGIKKGKGDVKITYDLFEVCLTKYVNKNSNKTKEDEERELKLAFKVFDCDKSGYIDKKELRTVLRKLGEKHPDKEIDEMFKAADIDGDGKVNYEEFVRMMAADIP